MSGVHGSRGTGRTPDYRVEYRLQRRDGTYRWLLSRGRIELDSQGRPSRLMGLNFDITERKAVEDALARTAERLQLAKRAGSLGIIDYDVLSGVIEWDDRMYDLWALDPTVRVDVDTFLAVLAHEWRNPLAPLRNSRQLLGMQSDPALGARLRVIMERQVDTLVRLVDDLLHVSRITHGKLQLDPARIDLCEAMRAALEACAPIIESARHRLDPDIPEQGVPVWGDQVRLAQVFFNLLNNAARYTPAPGIVCFSVRVEGGNAIVEVADNRVGIAPDMLERVFDMFAQAPGSTDHALHGLGIGLSLSRSLVTLHSGTIFAQSEGLGCGSRFIVRLSVLADEASTMPCAKSGPTGC